MKRSFLWALILVLTSIGYAQAQTTITGKVTDASTGESASFASVVIVGTTTGVTADDAGNYSITVPATATVLKFSAVGFKDLEIEIGGRSIINAVLTKDADLLDEAVVIGYGSARRASTATASVATVSSAR